MEIRDIGSFLTYFETIRERTLRVVRVVPAEKLEWRHAGDVFSSGDLARHIAAVERYTFVEGVLGRPSRYRGCGPELAEGQANRARAALPAALGSRRFALGVSAALSPSDGLRL